MRRYPLENVKNMRDLGGYPVGLNTQTQYGRFIRSDAPVKLSKVELKFLCDLNVKTVIDLRSATEVQKNPSALENIDSIEYYNFHLSGDGEHIKNEEDIPLSYIGMTEQIVVVAEIMRKFASTGGATLFHCTAGKDRTGVIAHFCCHWQVFQQMIF